MIAVLSLCSALAADPPQAVMEVTSSSAVLWGRTDRRAIMDVRVTRASGTARSRTLRTAVTEQHDFTGAVRVRGLRPATRYAYEIRFGPDTPPAQGQFTTAPRRSSSAPITIAWAGDFAGQNVCRHATEGFPILHAIHQDHPDLFIGLGT